MRLATAAVALHLLATTSGPALSDGSRWVAAPRSDGSEGVLDARTGRIERLAPPIACPAGDVGGATPGSGLLVWGCAGPGQQSDATTAIVDLGTGRVSRPRGLGDLPTPGNGPTSQITGVGSQGLEITIWDDKGLEGRQDLNWRTGRQHRIPKGSVVDLDRPSLARRAPMRRARHHPAHSVYARGAGLEAWMTPTRLFVERLSSGRRWSWRLPPLPLSDYARSIALARGLVLLSVPQNAEVPTYRVYAARVP